MPIIDSTVLRDQDLRFHGHTVFAFLLAPDMPMLNTCKVQVQAIWPLQTRRWPAGVLVPAKD